MSRRGTHTPYPVPGDAGDPRGFVALVEEFCTDLSTRGYADATVRNRRHQLAQLAGWLGERGVSRPVEVTRPMLVRYQRHLFHYRKANGDPLSFHSQAQRLLPIRAFFSGRCATGRCCRTRRVRSCCPAWSTGSRSPR